MLRSQSGIFTSLILKQNIIIKNRYNWMKYKKHKKKKKKKKGKKKAAAAAPKEPEKNATLTSANSSFKKGKATYTNSAASPTKNSQASDSPKKAGITPIPENIPPGTFGINIESTGFTDKSEAVQKDKDEREDKEEDKDDKDDKADEGEDAEGDNEIKMEFS